MTPIRRLIEIIIDAQQAKKGAAEAATAVRSIGQASSQSLLQNKAFVTALNLGAGVMRHLWQAAGSLGLVLGGMFTAHKIIENWTEYKQLLVDIQKLTGVNIEVAEQLEDAMTRVGLSLPVSDANLLGILSTTNALGIRGVEAIEDYQRAIAELETVTDFGGQAAAESLGRLRQLAGEPVTNIRQLTSELYVMRQQLGGTAAQTGQTALTIAQFAAGLNLSSKNAIALSGALSAVGAEGGSGSMAIGKLIRALDQAVRDGGEFADQLARIAGVSREDFAQAFEKDVAGALLLFIRGLNRLDVEGGNVMKTLAGLDLADGRLQRSLLPLIRNYQQLERAMKIANEDGENQEKLNHALEISTEELHVEWHKLVKTVSEVIEMGSPLVNVLTDVTRYVRQTTQALVGLSDESEEVSDAVLLTLNALAVVNPAFQTQAYVLNQIREANKAMKLEGQDATKHTVVQAEAMTEAKQSASEWARAVDEASEALALTGDRVKKARQSLEEMRVAQSNELREMKLADEQLIVHGELLKLISNAQIAFAGDTEKANKVIAMQTEQFEELQLAREKYKTLQQADDFFEQQIEHQEALILRLRTGVDEQVAPMIAAFNRLWGVGSVRAQTYTEQILAAVEETKLLERVTDATYQLGDAWGNAAEEIALAGKTGNEVLEDLYKNMQRIAFQTFVSRPLADFASGLYAQAAGSLLYGGAHGRGNVFNQGSVVPFARGGAYVTNGPEYFPMSGGRTGLRGEVPGKHEVVLPLTETSGGLGVQAIASGGGRSTRIQMNITTPDADSFRASERQIFARTMRRMRRS